MNNKNIKKHLVALGCFGVISIGLISSLIIDRSEVVSFETHSDKGTNHSPEIEAQQISDMSISSIESSASRDIHHVNSVNDVREEAFEEENPYEDAVVKAQILQVADQYELAMKYPPNSQPILPGEEDKYIVPETSEVDLPYQFDDLELPIKFSIKTNKYQYFNGDRIEVSANLDQLPIGESGASGASIQIVANISGLQGPELSNVLMQSSDDTNQSYVASFDTKDLDYSTWPSELQVSARANVDARQLFISTPIRFQAPSASLFSVDPALVNNEYLTIPLQFSVSQQGYYFVSANLYSATTERALLHLEQEGNISQADNYLSLQAHIAALKMTGDEGPYLLKDIQITRMSDELFDQDLAGVASQDAYEIEGYAFDVYQDIPYEDSFAEERLAFLRSLGKI